MFSKLNLNYPDEINKILEGLVSIYDECCSNIIVYGSTAINNLSYLENKGKYNFLSDMEFIVIPKKKENEYSKSFRKSLMKKSSDFLKTVSCLENIPFVDVYPVSKEYFENLDPRISTFELKNNAKIIKGDNLLALIKKVDINNYNSKIQNIEIAKALKILVLESRNWFFNFDSTSNIDYKWFCYFLNSCFLNILRTLLPIFGYFESTLDGRLNALHKIVNDNKLCHYFSKDVLDYFNISVEEKHTGTFRKSPKELFILCIKGYKSLLRMILNCDEKEVQLKIHERKFEIFSGEKWKINQLADLTCFFISLLDCIYEWIDQGSIKDLNMNKAIDNFDILSSGHNVYKLMCIMDKYSELEKTRWRIINSKD